VAIKQKQTGNKAEKRAKPTTNKSPKRVTRRPPYDYKDTSIVQLITIAQFYFFFFFFFFIII
jgi:hypothetical protein